MRATLLGRRGGRGGGAWHAGGLAVLTALAIGAVSAQPAAALTSSQADAIAMRTLAPQQQASWAAVFGLRAPLHAGRRIAAYSLSSGHHRLPGLRLHRRAWLFWEDLAYRAAFAHPSVLLLIDDASGRVLEQANLDMYPLIDGHMPPFVTPAGYRSGSLAIYSTLPLGGASAAADPPPRGTRMPASSGPPARAADGNGPITKQDLKGECLVTIGDRGPTDKGNNLGDAGLARNLTAMDAWAESVGLEHLDSGSSGPDLERTVYRAVTQRDCQDVLIYISGHGMAPPPNSGGDRQLHLGNHALGFPSGRAPAGGDPQIQLSAFSTTDLFGTTVGATLLTPQKVGEVISTIVKGGDVSSPHGHVITVKAHPNVRFKIKIDSCYSQRFADVLAAEFKIDPETPNAASPITIIEYSSSSWEPSLLYLPEWEDHTGKLLTNPTDNRHEISEFTNGNIHGLQSWVANPDSTMPRDLTAGLIQAFSLGASQDWARTVDASDQPPLTHPGAIGPGRSLGAPDELTKSQLTGKLVPIKSGTSGTTITTTVGPPSISGGGG